MRAFQPSPAFRAFFDQMIAAAEAPVVAGRFTVEIPSFADPQEQAFAQTILRSLAEQIDTMKIAVTPTTAPALTLGQAAAAAESGDAAAQALYEQMLWQQQSSGAP